MSILCKLLGKLWSKLSVGRGGKVSQCISHLDFDDIYHHDDMGGKGSAIFILAQCAHRETLFLSCEVVRADRGMSNLKTYIKTGS